MSVDGREEHRPGGEKIAVGDCGNKVEFLMEPPQRRQDQVVLPRQYAPGASPAPSDRRAVTLGILQRYKHYHLLLLQDGSVPVQLLLL